MKKSITEIVKLILYTLLAIAVAFFIEDFVIPYLTFKDTTKFLASKQQYVHIPVWKISFYIHVFSAFIALASGLTQFSKTILRDYKKLHRVIGRIYAWNILAINFPTGMVLAVTAIGSWVSKLGFITLDCLWFWFTYKAIVLIKHNKVLAHKHFMMRSYALTFSAITLRFWNTTLMVGLNLDPLLVYTVIAWMGFIPNLLFVEWLIRRRLNRKKMSVQPHLQVKSIS